jgi:hypothetical protein
MGAVDPPVTGSVVGAVEGDAAVGEMLADAEGLTDSDFDGVGDMLGDLDGDFDGLADFDGVRLGDALFDLWLSSSCPYPTGLVYPP